METGRKIDVTVVGGLALLALVAFAGVVTVGRFVRDTQWVTHTQEVRTTLATFGAQLREAKSDVRSFVISGDSTYVHRYRASLDTAQTAYVALNRLMADNAAQQQRLQGLRPLLDERVVSFDRTLALRPPGPAGPSTLGRGDARLTSQLATGEMLSERIATVLGSLERAERQLLLDRAAEQQRSELAAGAVVLVFAALGIGLALFMRRSIRDDLSERARIEQALRESEAKFSGIIGLAADAIITIDAQQAIQLFNEGAERIFGYEQSEVIGKSLEMLLPGRLAAAHRSHVAEFGKGPDTARRMGERRPVVGRRASGEEFPADASISKLSTSQGLFYTVVLRDVTEQKRLERHEHVLAECGRKLVATIEYAALLQLVADLTVPAVGEWAVVDVVEQREDTATRLHRVASHHADVDKDAALRALEARGINEDSPSRVLDVLRTRTPELIADVTDEWLEAHSDAEELSTMQVLGLRSLLVVPLVSGERTVGALTIGAGGHHRRLDSFDLELAKAIADRVSLAIENAALYDAARRATALRDQVLSIVSHDLRNPMSAVSMYARTLLDHPPLEEIERRKLYQSTLDAVEWMHRLMEDLLDVASIDAGRLSVTIEPQSVPHLVEGAVGIMSAHAIGEKVELAMEIDPQTPLVSADGGRIVQVLVNLISNAIKYTPEGGRVSIAAAPRGAEVLFTVRDTGAGIAPENLERVFDRFWHLRGNSRKRGTGLGLAIAQGIVAAHGGRIWAESTVGVGSTFFFTLPAASTMASGGIEFFSKSLGGATAS